MITASDAVRLVLAHDANSRVAIVVCQIWGDDQRYVVFVDLPSVVGGPPTRRWSFTVDAESGALTSHDPDVAAEDLIDGLTRIPWSPYRPCDPAVTSARIRRCPTCRGRLVPIVWGMPGPELLSASERGEVALGGCVINLDPPFALKACTGCGWTLLMEPNVP